MPRLKECMAAVVAKVQGELGPRRLLLGGRSMGGRTATMLAAGGVECDALLLPAYRLHPAGQPEKLRTCGTSRFRCFASTARSIARFS